MSDDRVSELLEEFMQEWSYPDGFFIKARFGTMDKDGYDHVISILERIASALAPFQDEKTLDRNLVLSLWHIPWFLELQRERINKMNEKTPLKHWGNWCSKIHILIYKIFGRDMEETPKKCLTEIETEDENE